MSRFTLMSAAVLALAAAGAPASADVSPGVISTFRGQLVVSKDELPEGKGDKDTIGKIKAVQLRELVGQTNDDVTYWHFHYTAFLNKTGASALKLKFVTDDKDRHYSADKQLEGVDPKSNVLSGDIAINEDEGLAKGKTYEIDLMTDKDVVVAKASIAFK